MSGPDPQVSPTTVLHHDAFEDNRTNWDDRSAQHVAAGYGIQALVDDPSHLSPEVAQDRDRLGNLAGHDVLHLQCHLGTDTISLSRLGAARVVGLDLSGASLRHARRIASRCHADIEYVQANVYDAREAVEGHFDLVYTSIGVLCWLPDVDAWARQISSLLCPGGRVLIRDDHPMSMTIDADTSTGLRVTQPYFSRAQPAVSESEHTYVHVPHDAPTITHTRNHEWSHSLGDVISAVLGAGMVLDSFEETPYAAWMPWPDLIVAEDPDRVPLQFVLTAHLPA